jgi:hypothetical protein
MAEERLLVLVLLRRRRRIDLQLLRIIRLSLILSTKDGRIDLFYRETTNIITHIRE